MPEYTAQTDAVGTLRLLEAIRTVGLAKSTRLYQASTSELYELEDALTQHRQSDREHEVTVPRSFNDVDERMGLEASARENRARLFGTCGNVH